MLAKASNDLSTPTRKDSCRSNSCGSACLRCVSANRHSVLSCRRSPTRPTTGLHSCAWPRPSLHSSLACAVPPKRLVSLSASESYGFWLKTFWWGKIPSPFVTASRSPRVRRQTGAHSQKAQITFCVRGVLSPLLSNLVLDELDRELERRGHRFVRYADDCNLYVGSERAGQRVMESVTHFITHRLKLKVNQAKSAVARPGQRKFLGFSFTGEREPRRRIAPKAIARFKERIREQTRRTRGITLRQMVTEIATYLRGLLGYYDDGQTPSVLHTLQSCPVRHIRSVVLKQWKRGRTPFRELRKRNSSKDLAAKTAGSAHGTWRIAQLARLGHCFAECLLCQARASTHGRAVLA